jgi:hypothetical protein
MVERWRKFTPEQKLQAQVILAGLLVGLYFGVFYQVSRHSLTHEEMMLDRQRRQTQTQARIDNLGGQELSPQTIQRKIEVVQKELGEVTASFDELDTGFAPVDSSDVRQQLMLEISNLAARTGFELLSVVRKGGAQGGDAGLAIVDPTLGRPLLEVTANTRFTALLGFLEGLKDLSFYASVMKLQVYARDLHKQSDGAPLPAAPGALFVSLELSI